jgi:lipopolysaccharide transport system ATP-binding protein
MSSDIISVENVSKQYRLGELSTGTLSLDIQHRWGRLFKKSEPLQHANNNLLPRAGKENGYVWSLKDVSFSVNEGEVFAIIGKNGAGKSTILKLLSKITKPTKGLIKIDGRIASLLEVGTGFHPDLSGRENIFLNGAILGMRKQEIRNRFDEIVEFSGIEKYIDTPVKRYSSGMFVRLAFAVAAHLEPEILIIDEVLAVGDAEFQQKCLGKMQDVVTKKGRTILFVSHNNTAIKQLCTRALLLEKGEVKLIDSPNAVLQLYQAADKDAEKGKRNFVPDENATGYFTEWHLEESKTDDGYSCYTGEQVVLCASFTAVTALESCTFHLLIKDEDDNTLLHAGSKDYGGSEFHLKKGNYRFRISFSLPLKYGKYKVEMGLLSRKTITDHWKTSTKLTILDSFEQYNYGIAGMLQLKTDFSYENTSSYINSF